ncbi:MAG TPA: hypothetical protein VGG28_14205 [Kofleriaceae bacterium]
MKLRAVHLEALVQVSREIFVDRMAEHLGETVPRDLIWRALDAAEDIGIVSEVGICRYTELWVAHGEFCDRDGPELLTLIDDGSLSEAAKLDAIEARVRG